MHIAVIGGGSWGTALGHLFAGQGHNVTMLLRSEEQATAITRQHENPRYLPGLALHPALAATTSPEAALHKAEICLLAVPCQHMRATLAPLAPLVPHSAIPICTSKGIEVANACTMQHVVEAVWPTQATNYAILSGPSFAHEVTEGKPTAVVLGCGPQALRATLREALSSSLFRVYSSPDVTGVELGGALKNVMAIAAGLCDGLELGHSARAALITRSLAEMSRLGVSLGAQAPTFMGLSGMGDLVLTCTGDLSRNRQVGLRLGRGESMEHITASMRNVAEGVKTTDAACTLGAQLGVDLPVAQAVRRIVQEGASPRRVVGELMNRALRDE
ncbi:NAD(P)H-dependent glycerol-3-phosphate dehydrogenase [Desulfovibrio cuneatus]|uniref:NAD(P)H-dependent glycerol-3-phosphate dehydrogenase n=1 Tax=Desulfovibrio cuneatus TaxID=159728 RepID=UPI000487A9A9|nr:NAD(P)H-dependent glycerol-3-phosphate dehydrogenase [Desulfovibrio cuneatus]